jgi:hypothetical protein
MKMGPNLTEIRRKPVLTLNRYYLIKIPLMTSKPRRPTGMSKRIEIKQCKKLDGPK